MAQLPAALAFAAFISLGLPDGVLGVAWPSIRGDFRLPLDALGILIAVTTAGYLAASFCGGAILRRLPIGSLLALSTAAAAAALLGIAAAPGWPAILACGVLAGLGGGAVDAGLNAYGARHFSARTLNWLHACFGLGATIGPLVATTVLGTGLDWRWSYALVGSAQLLLAATFLATRHRWRGTAGAGGGAHPAPAAPTLATLRRLPAWLGMATFFVYSGVELAVAQWSFTLLTLGRDIPATTAGLFVSLYWGSLMAGRVLFGAIAGRLPLVPAIRLCALAAVLGAALLWFGTGAAASLLGLMAIGFALAPIFASLISLTPQRVGAAHADSAIGFQVAAAALGGAAVTAGIGTLARGFGLEVIGLAVLLASLALLALSEAFLRSGGKGPGG